MVIIFFMMTIDGNDYRGGMFAVGKVYALFLMRLITRYRIQGYGIATAISDRGRGEFDMGIALSDANLVFVEQRGFGFLFQIVRVGNP